MKRIGKVENHYGGLWVKEDAGRYYWAIENYDGFLDPHEETWEEISEKLYHTLVEWDEQTPKEVVQ